MYVSTSLDEERALESWMTGLLSQWERPGPSHVINLLLGPAVVPKVGGSHLSITGGVAPPSASPAPRIGAAMPVSASLCSPLCPPPVPSPLDDWPGQCSPWKALDILPFQPVSTNTWLPTLITWNMMPVKVEAIRRTGTTATMLTADFVV